MITHGSRKASFLAAVVLGLTAAPAWSGDWAIDTSTTCRVWNPHPQLNETVKWSGACVGGFAQGVGTARWIRNNAAFETDDGEWQNGYQIGKGRQVWPSGRYDGEFAASEPQGQGTFVLQSARYEGEFRDGKPNGAGTLTTPTGSVQGTWRDGCLTGAHKAAFGVPLSDCH
jgi:hypothetical protein